MTVPQITFDELVHVGTLDAADKLDRSYEGAGLSVSDCPHDWIRIAELGGRPIWKLTCPGNRFVSARDLTADMRADIVTWGVAQNLVAETTVWISSFYDSEEGVEYQSVHENYDDAIDENDGEEPQRRVVHAATADLSGRIGVKTGSGDAFDYLLPVWVQATTDADGVWWADRHGRWSAPRGVILPGRLDRWAVTPV